MSAKYIYSAPVSGDNGYIQKIHSTSYKKLTREFKKLKTVKMRYSQTKKDQSEY